MDAKQKEVIAKLKQISRKIGYSPTRRDIPKLAVKCYKYFGSFNKAKEKAGLEIKNKRVLDFPQKLFKLNKDVVTIISYLTFDGHLYKDLSGFSFYSKQIKYLKELEGIIKKKFNIKGRYYFNRGRSKEIHSLIIFNKILAHWLYKLGAPKGAKTIQKFDIPKWIKNNKKFSREYLKIAFLCEGCNKEEKGRKMRIQINTAKSIDILDSGIKFMNSLRDMLKYFNIKTTECSVIGERLRKDNKISKDIRFRIKVEDNNKFINEIGWLK